MNNEQRGIGAGNWLVLCCAPYLVVAVINLFWPFVGMEYIQVIWLIVLSLPLWLSPVSKFVGIKPLWKL